MRIINSKQALRVEIDRHSGFCFGVVRAISKAEESLSPAADGERGSLVSLGDIVHNGAEVARLRALGLEVAPEDADLVGFEGRRVLVRAHGAPPATYREARQHDIAIVDATCPVVAALQKTVAEAHAGMVREGGQVVIFGTRGHAEVRGLEGQVEGGAVTVVESEGDLERIDFARPVCFLAQTTSSLAEFRRLGEIIRERAADATKVTILDTVCRQVAGREEHLADFARRFDVVIFVAGAKSSNGRVLFEAVKAANPRSHKIDGVPELRPEWFEGASEAFSVGVCGATSTPRWLMELVAEAIKSLSRV